MATNRWLGHAAPVAQVVTFLISSNTDTNTFILTIGGVSITYTASSDSTTSIASNLQALLAASEDPRFLEVTWTVSSSTITGTANTPGYPFVVSKSGTGTSTLTTTTASSGPNHGDLAANWSLGSTPGSGDDVLIDQGPDILYINGLSGAAYNSWTVKASYTGKNIGLPFRNGGDSGYVEYRTRAWPMNTAIPVKIGEGDGDGPTRVNINQATALAATIYKTGTRQDTAVPVVNISGCSSGTLSILSGDAGIAADDDTLAGTVTTATLGAGITLVVGLGATVTTCNQNGATITGYGTVTTVNQLGGTSSLYIAPTTINCYKGKVVVFFTGTCSTLNFVGQGGQDVPWLDLSQDPRGRTFTDHTFTGGAYLFDPYKSATFTNAGAWHQSSLAASTFGQTFSSKRS